MINFVDAGGQPNNPSAAAANLALIHTLIANTSVANPGGVDYWGAGPHIYFPPGNFHFSGPIRIRKAVRLEGSSAGTRANYNTMFTFPLNSQGLVLDSFDTDNLSYLSYPNRLSTGAGTRIEGISFRGASNAQNSAHGVLIRAFVVMRDVQVNGFGGNGIYVKADLTENHGGQASNSQFYDCGGVSNGGSGLVIEGGDANIIQVVGGDYSYNSDWGVADLSFLGCTFTGIHASQNAQPGVGRGTNETHLVTYPGGSGQVWAIRLAYWSQGLAQAPGSNEMVWTRYYVPLGFTPPTWTAGNTNGLVIRPGGPYLTASESACSVWTGCYSEMNQGPSQMTRRAIVIGGLHGSGIQATDNSGTGQPVWLGAHNGELDLKTNLRVKGLLLGQKRARSNDSVGMKMSAASSAPVSGAAWSVAPYMEYSWSPGDIVWNQDRSATQSGVTPPLGWRCTAGPDSFEEIPFPANSGIGANPTFTAVTANQFVVPGAGSIANYEGEMYVYVRRFRVIDVTTGETAALFGDFTQFHQIGTTASAANAFLDAGVGNRLLRSTSSSRYKTGVEDVEAKYLDNILKLRPVKYRSLAGADDPSLSHFGLIAEEVAGIEPRLVSFTYADEDYEKEVIEAGEGETVSRTEKKLKKGAERKVPDGVQYDRLTVLLLGLVKRQQGELDALKAQVADFAASASPGRPGRS